MLSSLPTLLSTFSATYLPCFKKNEQKTSLVVSAHKRVNKMIQDILALLTVAAALFYALWSFARIIFPSKKQPNNHCAGCLGGCELSELKKMYSQQV